ncbi:MAG: LysR substrate-binding domain-containing protein [Elioraea sp.]|nr:LysR substrate-binding domain-containing protein [Elioraea sp.]
MKENLSVFARRVSLRQLRAFGALVAEGSISGAAQRLALTPPAISQQLQKLEEAAGGLPLYDRTSKGVRLTDAGREILAALERVEAALADVAVALETLRGVSAGRVAIGMISTAKYFAPLALAAFKRANPGVELAIRIGNREAILSALRSFELDLAITGYPPEDFPVTRAVLGPNPHVIIAAPDHPLAGSRDVPLSVVGRETILLREPGSGTRALLKRLFPEEPPLGPRIEIGSNETIKQAVMAGMGIALISAHTCAAELADGRLALIDAEGLPVVRQWFVIRRADKRLLPAAEALWQHLVASAGDFLPRLPAQGTASERAKAEAKQVA